MFFFVAFHVAEPLTRRGTLFYAGEDSSRLCGGVGNEITAFFLYGHGSVLCVVGPSYMLWNPVLTLVTYACELLLPCVDAGYSRVNSRHVCWYATPPPPPALYNTRVSPARIGCVCVHPEAFPLKQNAFGYMRPAV